jgi:hypothetical protein
MGIISRLELQQGTPATHFLDSQGQASSTGNICSKAPQPLTSWRDKDRHHQQARIAARHHSHSQTGEPRTGIISRPELQQKNHSHSQSEEQRTEMISTLELQQGTIATHILESQGQALSAG